MRAIIAVCLLLRLTQPLASQDTTVVRSQVPPAWRSPRLVEELRIGALEGDDKYIFGQISYLEVTSGGSIWVVDQQGPRVRIYDRSGRFLRAVYRRGSGPGEMKSVTGIELTPQRQVAIWDIANTRISLYRETGEYVRSFRVNSGNWVDDNLRVDRTGRFWVFTVVHNPGCIRHLKSPNGSVIDVMSDEPRCYGRHAFVRLSAGGILQDTVFIPVPEQRVNLGFVVSTPEGRIQPFVPEWHSAVSPLGYFVTAFSNPYGFNLVDGGAAAGNGATKVTRVLRPYKPIRLASGERAEWNARRDYQAARPMSQAAGFKIPDTKPAIRSLSVDDDGRIWIQRYVEAVKRSDLSSAPTRAGGPPGLTWREPTTFDVFEPSGRLLGTIVAPRGVRFLVQRGNHIWGVLRGELDENYVVRYRIETT